MCLNLNEESTYKSLSTYSPAFLGDSLRFTVVICTYFLLWMSVVGIVIFFQNTMICASDNFCMGLPPYYKEWFKLRHPNIKITYGKVKLIM